MSLTVMKFEADWCGPCRALTPVFKKIASVTTDVIFEVVNVDENPELSKQMKISSIPTMIFVKDGNVVDTLVGLHKEQTILDTINKWK